jgi:hypothetical protein
VIGTSLTTRSAQYLLLGFAAVAALGCLAARSAHRAPATPTCAPHNAANASTQEANADDAGDNPLPKPPNGPANVHDHGMRQTPAGVPAT